MNTPLCAQRSSLSLAKLTPWKPMAPTFLPENMQNLINNPATARKIHTYAKGFGSTPAIIQESTTSKNFNKHNANKDEEIPREVFNRMIRRILVSVGAPMALGIAQLHVFGLLKEQHLWDVPMWIPFMTTFLTFGASALGIAYGALSTNLDPNKKGSLLGLEEVQLNWVDLWKEEDENKKKSVENL